MWPFTEQSQQGFGRWIVWARQAPSWPMRTAITCGIAAMVIPLALLLLVGLLVGFVVFAVLSMVEKVAGFIGRIGGGGGSNSGERKNVRVIDQRDSM